MAPSSQEVEQSPIPGRFIEMHTARVSFISTPTLPDSPWNRRGSRVVNGDGISAPTFNLIQREIGIVEEPLGARR
jgi:hypothetical protein